MILPVLEANPVLRNFLGETPKRFSQKEARGFMAGFVECLGEGGQRWVERVLGWNRGTLRKGAAESAEGTVASRVHLRGRKSTTRRLPSLEYDIIRLVEPEIEQDPTFFTTRVFRKITAKSVRASLIESGKYGIDDLPSERTISSLLCDLGFPPRKVVKSRPLKKIPQTDAIFERLHKINNEADNTPGVIRLSIDVKAAIKVGPFSRGGISRRRVKACDHDFAPVCTLQLAGINLPQQGENYFHFNETKANADMIMDTLEHFWPKLRERHSKIDKLVLNLDNGPENHSRRTQFIKRLVDFVDMKAIPVTLAYYPPYHSKYNPIERVWGVLEQHWNGDLLSTREKVFGLAETMEWRGEKPEINVSDQIYEKGVKLAASEMRHYESRLQRASGLEPWFVDICPN